MKILGLHMGHDSSAALVENGKTIADVAEERFRRIKHYAGLPIESIQYCLKEGNIDDINELDAIVIPNKYGYLEPEIECVFGLSKTKGVKPKSQFISYVRSALGAKNPKPPIYYPSFNLRDGSKIKFVEHHLAHAASAYYTRKTSDECLIITADGIGDGVTIGIWKGSKGKIKSLKKYKRDAALGWFYSIVTEGLHWWHGDGEGKTMGLAPYGDASKAKGVLSKYHPVFKDGKVKKGFDLGEAFFWKEAGSYQWHFDEAKEIEALIKKHGKENIAAEAQNILEEQMIEMIKYWVNKTGIKKVAFAGGIFLNVKLNQRIFEQLNLDEQHIYPNCGDSGLAVGGALNEYYNNNIFKGNELKHLYTGPSYSDDYIEDLLKARNLKYRKMKDPAKEAAELLAQNKIIGWFQGRMESGPRALGNRSILMSPLKPENKDIINARVKFREGFRPFCPSLLWENACDYFDNWRDEYFMITSFTVKDGKGKDIPAVTHVDNTARPQMVKKEVNSLYWNLIKEFGDITGEYIILNTSFNIKGEPIINRPQEAIRCFFDGGLDYLVLGSYIIGK